MIIQVNTAPGIQGSEGLIAGVTTVVQNALSRFSAQVTRVEVHVSEETGRVEGVHDKRCMMEARLEGHQPLAVTQHSATSEDAIQGAADKLERLIEHTTGRLRELR
jgi:ribosome-associated translation inhibitor RaiA